MSLKMSQIQNANFTLPEGWRCVRLGEVCSIYPGQHILESDYNRGRVGVGYLTGPADFGETCPSVTKWTERPKAWCEPGDVLVTVKGAGVGKSNLAPNEQVAIGRQLMAIRPKPELMEQRFLYYVVIIHLSKLQAKSVGSTVPNLGLKDIETLEISLPPFHEQKRIAAKIQEMMQEVERARTACEKQLEAAKALPAAYLREVFESEEAKKWERKRLGEVCEINPRRPKNFTRSVDALTTFVPMATVDERTGSIANAKVVPYENVSKGYTYFEEGDVLFAKITPCMQNGKHVIARHLIDKVGFGTTGFHVLRPNSNLLPEWIHFFIRQPYFLQEATAYFTGTVGQQRVPEEFLANYIIPLPPLLVQQRIASELKEKMTEVEKLCAGIERQLEAINALPQAILGKAFRGEL
jgi:type I restriction enzyme S subunit